PWLRLEASLLGFLRTRFQIPSLWSSPSLLSPGGRGGTCHAGLLSQVVSGDAAGDLADSPDQLSALGGGNDAARIKQVKQVRALQAMIVGSQEWKPDLGLFVHLSILVEELLCLFLMEFE